MHFSVEDVVRNVKAFVISVKRATGNREDAQEEKKIDSTKPGMCVCFISNPLF